MFRGSGRPPVTTEKIALLLDDAAGSTTIVNSGTFGGNYTAATTGTGTATVKAGVPSNAAWLHNGTTNSSVAGFKGNANTSFSPSSNITLLCRYMVTKHAEGQLVFGYASNGATTNGRIATITVNSGADGHPIATIRIGSTETQVATLSGTSHEWFGHWNEAAMTYDGSTLSLYTNGEFANSTAVAGSVNWTFGDASSQAWYVGADTHLVATTYGLAVSDARAFNAVLSQEAIANYSRRFRRWQPVD